MVDWLIVWSVVEATGILARPILEDLAKDSAKDYAKDFFKDCLKKLIRLPEKDVQKEAYGKALKEFLELVQQELENAGYQEVQIKQYIQPVKRFIDDSQVAAIVGRAFESECRSLDTKTLAQTWQTLDLPHLPPDFDWELVCKLYIRKVKAIIQNSDTLRPIFAAEAQAAAAESLQQLVGIAPGFDLARYAEGLQEQYGNLKLESLDTTGVYYNELKLWKIFVPQNVRECQEFLPQVYEIPKEHLRQLRERGELDEAAIAEAEMERYRRVYVEQPIRPVLEVVGDPTVPNRPLNPPSLGDFNPAPPKFGGLGGQPLPHVVILGDPGSGKSTLLQYLALVWAERPVSELPLYPIPLLIELRTYARDKQEKKCHDILSFIHSGNITCRLNQQQLHEKLKAGDAIALFDGIDEVFDPQLREEVVTDLHRFTNDYPQVQAIATSRWLGYKAQRLRDAGFRHFMLQDLEDQQIENFIQHWHDLTFQEGLDKTRKRDRLQKAIHDSKAIRELAGNPLLLTMMAILNRNQELPRDRPELYNQASRVLLHQWDVERNLIEQRLDPLTIDYRDKQAMLRKVAYHMQSSEKGLAGNIISAADLERILTDYLKTFEVEQPRTVARLMIQQLRTRNFILCYLGADSYAFVHRTFLEYFCATEFVYQFEKQKTLTFEQLKNEVFGKHWWDETWHEVLRLICGMIDAKFAGQLIEFLAIQKRDDAQSDSFTEKEMGSLLLATECLIETQNRSTIATSSDFLLKLIKGKIEDGLIKRGDLQYVKAFARVVELAWQGETTLLIWLKSCLEEGYAKQTHTRYFAINAIIQGWGNNPDIIPLLKTCVKQGYTWSSTRVAAIALAQHWKGHPEILPFLKDLAQNSQVVYTRGAALDALAQGWSNNQDTLLLLQAAKDDKYGLVREVALEALGRNWKDHPKTLPLIKTAALTDQAWQVRATAVELLVEWGEEATSNIFDLLYQIAMEDGFEREEEFEQNPRLLAMQGLINVDLTHHKTLELLHDRAINDPDEQVREFAKEQLAKLEQASRRGD
ncbi:HEAT repeat domain-containing protein [Oscillatoria sp. FACHB-1407]|uniref:NACHT domain-containing protein n=1 Tax=Oscillatoria sp. FACHB-1407 TaxID=2692847 RepID=UPI001687D130|nr:NACHT domain-containing protein [Oscillatoria sp. FACHB-1407]MBD2460233.1 HEAT repeat domain-containing protein [Oscillatoria sp. FACHB-1407]